MQTTTSGEAADLYAGLALPPPKKRTAEKANVDNLSSQVAPKRQKTTPHPSTPPEQTASEMDLTSVVARLKTHMLADKKFAKASKLFCTLMTDKLTNENRSVFLDALTEMIELKGVSVWSGKREFAELIKLLLSKQDVYPEKERLHFQNWSLLAITHHELFTDDSFQFNRAAKLIKNKLETVVTTRQPDQLELLMPLLRTLFNRHSIAWVKTSVESVLNVCTRHRLLFPDLQRDEVDKWTATIQERRHASSTNPHNAASDMRRNIVELDESNASQAKPKVGRSNHPLFNREL